MRIAILTALAIDPDAPDRKSAFRVFAGRSVLSHQIDCAIELDCESIVCLVGGVGQEVIACQHRAEAAGLRFQAIQDLRRLSGLIKADDDIFVLRDGLMPSCEIAAEQVSERSAVLAFPAEKALSQGFERIDAERAWAGVLRTRGQAVERLNELPADADAASSLLRIALQSGIRVVTMDPALISNGEWFIRGGSQLATAWEKNWIARRVQPAPFRAPGLAIAERIGIRLARDISGTRYQRVPIVIAVVAGILAGIAAIFGYPMTGLLLAAVLVFFVPIADIVRKLARLPRKRPAIFGIGRALGWAADFLVVVLIADAIPRTDPEWLRFFLPALLVGLLRHAEHSATEGWNRTYADRITLLVVVLAATFFNQLQLVVAVLSIIVLVSLMIDNHRRAITTD